MIAVVAHATGNQNVRQTLRSVAEAGYDVRFHTTIGVSRGTRGSRLLERRRYDLPHRGLRLHPAREVVRNLALRAPNRRLRRLGDADQRFGPEWVAAALDAAAARDVGVDTALVYAYLEQAEELLAAAARVGARSVLEAHHAHWRYTERVLEVERDRHPEWAVTIPRTDSSRFHHRQDDEVRLASVVVAPSAQVASSVLEVRPDAPVAIVPYGCPAPTPARPHRAFPGDRPLEVLYVGRLQASKGVADLAEALGGLGPHVRLTIAGPRPNVDCRPLDTLLASADYLGAVPRDRVLAAMHRADVLVLPSLVEGRSLAVLEALSVGLPCVVTPGSGNDDLVAAGAGIVVPNGRPDLLSGAFERLLAKEVALDECSSAATAIATEYSWSRFRSVSATLLAAA